MRSYYQVYPTVKNRYDQAKAQKFQASFYTGDKRLFNKVNPALPWVYLVE
jgi:hypothetical protein